MAKPIVKWAGGKRQILDKIKELMPSDYGSYYEPFIGGAALLLDLLPDNATINDVNKELLAIYKCLASENLFNDFINELDVHKQNHTEDYYMQIRNMDREASFESLPIWQRAARALYLNKACFNGLYRVNSQGYFNVPSGHKVEVHLYDEDNMREVHEYFINHHITIHEGDFELAVENANQGDFVYFDPPYDTLKEDTFTSYTADCFGKEEQRRLAGLFKNLSDRGVYVMLSNHNTEFIRELYNGFNIHIIQAKRMINADSKGRGFVEEVIITNY